MVRSNALSYDSIGVYLIAITIFIILIYIFMKVKYWLKSNVLFGMSMIWLSVHNITDIQVSGTRGTGTKQIWNGFPTKWLIFISVIFLPTFWNSNFLSVLPCMDAVVSTLIVRRLSPKLIAQDSCCTWVFLQD